MKPSELDEFAPCQFFNAMIGWNDANLELWRQARFVGWSTWVAQNTNKEVRTPEDWLKLPGDTPKIDMEKVKKAMEHASTVWNQHSF